MIYEPPKNPLPIYQGVGQARGVEPEETKEAHVSSRLYPTPNYGIPHNAIHRALMGSLLCPLELQDNHQPTGLAPLMLLGHGYLRF